MVKKKKTPKKKKTLKKKKVLTKEQKAFLRTKGIDIDNRETGLVDDGYIPYEDSDYDQLNKKKGAEAIFESWIPEDDDTFEEKASKTFVSACFFIGLTAVMLFIAWVFGA